MLPKRIVFTASGAANGIPKCKSMKRNGEIGHCEDLNIPLDVVRDIVKSDDRFTNDVDFLQGGATIGQADNRFCRVDIHLSGDKIIKLRY